MKKRPHVRRANVYTHATRTAILVVWLWIVLFSVTNNFFFTASVPQQVLYLNIVLLLVAALNFYLSVTLWRIRRIRSELFAAMVMVLVLSLTTAIFLSLGLNSAWFVFYYPLVLLLALVMPARVTVVLTLGIVSVYVAVGLVMRGGVDILDPEWGNLVAKLGVLLLVGLFASLLSDRQQLARTEGEVRRSEEAQRRLAMENAVLAEIGRIITSSLDINEVYERFVEQVRKLIPSDRTTIVLYGMLTNEYVAGPEVADRGQGATYSSAGTLTEILMRERRGVLVVAEDESELASTYPGLLPHFRAGYRTFLAVPLISKDQVIGALHLRCAKAHGYTVQDLQRAERVGAQIAGAIANARLFKERTAAAKDLAESEERFRHLVENAGDAFLLHDAGGKIVDVNHRSCESLGYTREELLALTLRDIEPTSTAGNVSDEWKQAEIGVPVTRQGVHRRKDGTTFPVEVRLVGFTWHGRPLFIALARDITKRKLLEAQFLQAQKMEAVGQLAGGVAHDFNNLLTAIISYSDLGMMKLSPEDRVSGYLEEIQRAAERASQLTRQLLAFSRRQVIEPEVISLNDLIFDMDKMLRRLIGEDVELVILPAPDLGLAKADPGQIEQVLVNLAVNARDAMPDGGRLVIETSNATLEAEYTRNRLDAASGEHLMVAISDTGTGMTEEVKARVFEPFFTTKEVGKGTGLGLSTCYGIVAQSGGHITIESEPGRGTTFKIYFPRVEQAASAPPLNGDPCQLPIGTETLLVVEDEPLLREVASRVLRERGYTVWEASNGHQALGLVQEHAGEEIGLLLTDVVMPLMGGVELAEQLKEVHPETRVIFTSGYTDDTIFHHGAVRQDSEFMQKPFTPAVLAHKVREVLDR